MTWTKTPADRRRDSKVYGAEWRRAREAALQRAGRRCQQCGSSNSISVDHITPVSQGGTHHPANLQVLCGKCHRAKTATEGRGYRRRASQPQADPEPRQSTLW